MKCQWCVEVDVAEPGLCERCKQEPDAVEFKQAHDEQCSCEPARAYRAARADAALAAYQEASNEIHYATGD